MEIQNVNDTDTLKLKTEIMNKIDTLQNRIEELKESLDIERGCVKLWRRKYYDLLADKFDVNVEWFDKILQADIDKRLVILPVPIGTPVYSTIFCAFREDGTIKPQSGWTFTPSMLDEWGKGWFATYEEAEKYLREKGE